MIRFCRLAIGVYALLYVVALAVAVVGTQGLFGTQPDGLAAVWLIFLGLPWIIGLTPLSLVGLPVIIGQVVAVVAPLLNIWLLWRFCRSRNSGS